MVGCCSAIAFLERGCLLARVGFWKRPTFELKDKPRIEDAADSAPPASPALTSRRRRKSNRLGRLPVTALCGFFSTALLRGLSGLFLNRLLYLFGHICTERNLFVTANEKDAKWVPEREK